MAYLSLIAERAADLAMEKLSGRIPTPNWDDAYEGALQALKIIYSDKEEE